MASRKLIKEWTIRNEMFVYQREDNQKFKIKLNKIKLNKINERKKLFFLIITNQVRKKNIN